MRALLHRWRRWQVIAPTSSGCERVLSRHFTRRGAETRRAVLLASGQDRYLLLGVRYRAG